MDEETREILIDDLVNTMDISKDEAKRVLESCDYNIEQALVVIVQNRSLISEKKSEQEEEEEENLVAGGEELLLTPMEKCEASLDDLIHCLMFNNTAESCLETLKLFSICFFNILEFPNDDKYRKLRLRNPKVHELIVQKNGAEEFLVRIARFKKEQVVGGVYGPTSEFIYMFEKNQQNESRLKNLLTTLQKRIELYTKNNNNNSHLTEFTVAIKVLLPNGQELKGNFRENDSMRLLRLWVKRIRNDPGYATFLKMEDPPILTTTSDNLKRRYGDDYALGGFNKMKLVVVSAIGEEFETNGQKQMEMLDKINRERTEKEKQLKLEKARRAIQLRKEQREAEKLRRSENIKKFNENRIASETRAKRIINDGNNNKKL